MRWTVALVMLLLSMFMAALPAPARADPGPWRLRLEPVFVDVGGHDPELARTSGGDLSLESESGVAYTFELRRDRRERWGWGLAFFWLTTAQDSPRRTGSGSAGSPVEWGIADGSFSSADPSEVLFLERLEDTDLNAWTVDLYALRTLRSNDRGALQLLFGLRAADFDNDTRAVVGIEGTVGTRIDASSNYSLMIGPLVGVGLERERGKHRFELLLTQSLVFGDAELGASQSDFVGSFAGDSQEFTGVRRFSQPESVDIPITELGARWVCALAPSVALGLGARASVWTDVSIPPGVRPGASLDTTYETTVTFSGLFASLEVAF
jgi:hypothetical protein